MGEVDLRGNVIPGDESTDAGKTWKHVGLADTQMIGKIRIEPNNCNRAYVLTMDPSNPSVLGAWHVYRKSGRYRTAARAVEPPCPASTGLAQ